MQKETDYLREQLNELKNLRAGLPAKFSDAQKQVEAHVEMLMEKAGILGEIKRVRDELEKLRAQIQRQADVLSGKIEVIEHVFDTYHRDPVAPGTVLHGIDISKLDWQTRLMVRSGNLQTIAALGGKLDVAPAPAEATVSAPKAEAGAADETSGNADYTLADLQDLVR